MTPAPVSLTIDDALTELRVITAHALATALVTGIDQAEAEGRPLTQLQQCDMAELAIMAYADTLGGAQSRLTVMAALRGMRADSLDFGDET